jgi:hypothetical protein
MSDRAPETGDLSGDGERYLHASPPDAIYFPIQ